MENPENRTSVFVFDHKLTELEERLNTLNKNVATLEVAKQGAHSAEISQLVNELEVRWALVEKDQKQSTALIFIRFLILILSISTVVECYKEFWHTDTLLVWCSLFQLFGILFIELVESLTAFPPAKVANKSQWKLNKVVLVLPDYDKLSVKWLSNKRTLRLLDLGEQLLSKIESTLSHPSPRPAPELPDGRGNPIDPLQHVRKRLPLTQAQALAQTLDLTDKEMARVLAISIRTYHRLKGSGLLNEVASERLLLFTKLADYGLEVFNDQDQFNQWLRLPLRELRNNSPLNSLDTIAGFSDVETILDRIEYGVYG